MMRLMAAAGVAMAFGALTASAQLSSEGGPIQIDSEYGEVLDREKKAIYWGNVEVLQGDAALRADRIEVNYTGGGDGEGLGGSFGGLSSIVAIGDVFYVTPDFKARGERGTYQAEGGLILLEGDVVVSRCGDVATGETLTLMLDEGRSTLSAGEDGRVRTFISEPGDTGSQDCPT